MTVSETFRTTAKRSRRVHAGYKLARQFGSVPIADWAHPTRTASVFRILPNTMVPPARLFNAYEIMETVERERLDGSVVECGVWAGGTAGLMASVSKRHANRDRVFHLFDSFEGLPQPSVHDVDVLDEFRKGHPELDADDGRDPSALVAIGACAAPLEAVRELFFEVLEIDSRQVQIHRGWFQDTIPAVADEIGPIAVLRIDGDWYESTRQCLEGLYDHVVEGGFVIIDDYGTFVGCAKAVDEFIESRRLDVRPTPIDGEGVFFQKNGAA